MSTMKILGVDPGIRGGLAVVLLNANGARLLDAIDIPVIGTAAKERVDIIALRDWVLAQQPAHALIERAQAMPKQGASSGFKYGRAVGAIEAVIVGCAVPMTIIEPATWKKFHGLRGGEKELSRQRALQLFPDAHALLARKRDHGRAEAALIAMTPIRGMPKPEPTLLDEILGGYCAAQSRILAARSGGIAPDDSWQIDET
jgi:crossover junction endodeoxyribonuclease RuvC